MADDKKEEFGDAFDSKAFEALERDFQEVRVRSVEAMLDATREHWLHSQNV